MSNNHRRVRISVSIPEEVARQLDNQRGYIGMNRSEAVAEAVTEWVARGIESDEEKISGQRSAIEAARREILAQTKQSAQELIQLMRHQFSSVAEFDDAEIERLGAVAIAKREQRAAGLRRRSTAESPEGG